MALASVICKATAPKFPPLGPTERAVRDALLKAIEYIRDAWARADIERALERNDIEGAIDLIRFDLGEEFLMAALPLELRRAYELAGHTALETAEFKLRFDIVNPEAVRFIREHSLELIQQWGESSREAVRNLLLRSFQEGIAPRPLAKLIRETGIGLTERLQNAVENYRSMLLGQGLNTEQIANRVERYYRKLLKYRSEMIARTEIIRASREGSQEAWRQAAEKGLIDTDVAVQEWSTAEDERVCPVCEPLDGKTTPLDGQFPGEGGYGPPAHVACRCALILLVDGPRTRKSIQKTPPWKIVEHGGKFLVVGVENGKVYGTHPTHEAARRHLAALYANVPEARR